MLRFRAVTRLPPSRFLPPGERPAVATVPPPSAPAPVPSDREAICRACEWFHAATDRCGRPCGMCPVDDRRRTPWQNMPRCPGGLWPA